MSFRIGISGRFSEYQRLDCCCPRENGPDLSALVLVDSVVAVHRCSFSAIFSAYHLQLNGRRSGDTFLGERALDVDAVEDALSLLL